MHPERFRVAVLARTAAGRQWSSRRGSFKPDVVVLADPKAAEQARAALSALGSGTRVESGAEALAAEVTGDNVQVVMAAIVGSAGLMPTLAAVRAGKRVLLANKEALVMTGRLLMEEVRRANDRNHPDRQRAQRDFSMHAGRLSARRRRAASCA